MTQQAKQAIQSALAQFAQPNQPLRQNSLHLLGTLGYESDRQLENDSTPAAFLSHFNRENKLRPDKAHTDDWQEVHLLCQLSDDDIRRTNQLAIFESAGKQIDNSIIESYLFIALRLTGESYSRTQLAQITREINKLFAMPALLIFQHGQTITLSIINRRLHKREASQDVLEKVTLIKDIRLANPHRAHIEILFDLSLEQLQRTHSVHNFVELHRAWQKTLDSSELNKKFFNEIANWYFWAVNQVTFPPEAGPDETRNATSVIRLITRLIFVWFLKEKGVIPEALFNRAQLDKLLRWEDFNDSTYYKAILQNLFFATLNQEMNTPAKPDNRKFRGTRESGQAQHYMIHNVYRYEQYFRDPAAALALLADIPFLNGGLFECLDKKEDGQTKVIRVDGFSDRTDNPLRVPDELFFGAEQWVDLNEAYGTSGKQYKVRGLIETLQRYKFTIDENTPIEEEIALDPELLGKVFENLLAAYNPETGTTARKQTGSFYTPREIVNYMVDESLLAYLATKLEPLTQEQKPLGSSDLETRLRHLLAYNEEPHQFNKQETAQLITAIDEVKIFDPACGSGAFPMGILHKLVFILGKLDPHNEQWKERQIAPLREAIKASKAIPDSKIRNQTIEELEEQVDAIEAAFQRNELDYGRKLYLIENCIYGVDIQPVAVQIAKLRFFISLVVDQRLDGQADNRGILPLPNLETKFVAANTLLGIEKPAQRGLRSEEVVQKERELAEVRSKHFRARTPRTKEKWRTEDKRLRGEISVLLEKEAGLPHEDVQRLAAWDPYNQNQHADFFDVEWMFGLETGFDVVIGNPPYVRQEKIQPLKPALQRQYSCYTGVADLYVYFFEGGVQWLQEGGVLCYICSNKYFRAGYGKKLRGFLSQKGTVRQLIDFGDAPVFTAIAYPSILLWQKVQPVANQVTAFNWEPGPPVTEFAPILAANKFKMPQTALTSEGWRLEQKEVLALLAKLRGMGKPLGEYVAGRFYRGILTGLNEAFVVDRATRDRLIAEHPSSADLLKPFLRGRDVKRWQVDFADQYLIKIESSANKAHPWSGKKDEEAEKVFAQTYPAIHAHLELYRDKLIKRSDQGQYFWELRACIYWEEFESPKIILGRFMNKATFSYDPVAYFHNDALYMIAGANEYVVSILNSSIGWWFLTKTCTDLQNGYLQAFRENLFEVPVFKATTKQQEPIIKLVQQITINLQANPTADVSALEREIDELVYALYHLTPAEIALVEGRELSVEEAAQVAAPARLAAPPLLFTGQAPQGSFGQRLKRVQALTTQASPPAIQELVAALGDENSTIVWTASAGLRQIGGAQVVGVLQAFIAHTTDVKAQEEAEKVLARL